MTDDSLPADDRVSQALAEFLASLEAGTPPDREVFLAAHSDVADQLAPLLASVEAIHGVGRQVSAEIGNAPRARLRPTTRISRYEVVREIGRGGMGVVYEAVDTNIGQRVAIKVLATEATTDTHQKERFLREARIAALLQHPNIVPILGVEEMDGVTYLVMQYIDGKPLSAVIRSLRVDGGLDSGTRDPSSDASLIAAGLEVGFVAPTDSPATSTGGPVLGAVGDTQYFRRTAILGVQAATALAFVHDNDVLHRDIKPGNLLLDVHGHLWLSDFGLAKAKLSSEALTTGGRVGTLRYMSPEQAVETALDRRSDIYSLGATLYELLTLHPAFPSDRPHLLERVRGEEPQSIRCQNPAVPQDLATIVQKAMAKLPGDRYSTAQELVADLKRFLDGHPVLARPLNRWQRSRRWAWRWHRPLAAVASALLIGLLVGLSAAAWVSWRAYRTESDYRERLERREGLFRELVAELNKSEGVIRHLPNGQGERLRILRRLKEVVCQWADDPGASDESQVAALRACLLLGEVELLWGDLSNSAAVLHELLDRSTALQATNPDDPELRFFVAQGHLHLAGVARRRADASLVIEHTNHAIAILERLKTDYSGRAVYRNPLSLAYTSLAEWHAAEYRFLEAVESCQKGIESDRWLAAKYPDNHPQSYIRLGDSLQNLGRFLICAGKPDEAEAALRESVKNHEVLCEPRFAEPKTNRETTLSCRYQLAALLIARGKLKEARSELERAIKEIEAFVALFRDRPRHEGTLAMAYGSLGQLEYLEDRIEESRKAFAKALVLLNRFPRPEGDLGLLDFRSTIPSADVREADDLARALKAVTDPKLNESRNFCLLRVLVVAGDAKAAEAILPLVRKPQPHPRYNSELVYLTIIVEAGTGRLERAKQLFEAAEKQPLLEVADDGILRVWRKKAEQAIEEGR